MWSCDDNQKVCKKEISVGEIDEEMLEYQILDGLTENDYIAFPDELTQKVWRLFCRTAWRMVKIRAMQECVR